MTLKTLPQTVIYCKSQGPEATEVEEKEVAEEIEIGHGVRTIRGHLRGPPQRLKAVLLDRAKEHHHHALVLRMGKNVQVNLVLVVEAVRQAHGLPSSLSDDLKKSDVSALKNSVRR